MAKIWRKGRPTAEVGLSTDNDPQTAYMDEFMVGTSFGDIYVPEPSVLSVLSLASALLALRRTTSRRH